MRNQDSTKASDAESLRSRLGYISEDELFALIKVAKGTGRNRQSAGTLPAHFKVGREKLYLLSEVNAWIRRKRVQKNGA